MKPFFGIRLEAPDVVHQGLLEGNQVVHQPLVPVPDDEAHIHALAACATGHQQHLALDPVRGNATLAQYVT